MKKRFLALLLALVMALALLPTAALAADAPHDVDILTQPAAWEDWGDPLISDSKLIINGVIGQQEFALDGYFDSVIFDVTVDGGYTLNMSYPAGRLRNYSIYVDNVLLNGEPMEDPPLPEKASSWFDSEHTQNQYVFTCTEDMISKPGAELLYHFWLDWGDGPVGSDYTTSDGNVTFWLRVNPSQSSQSSQPTLPTVESIPATGTAYVRTQTVKLDGKDVEFQTYALKDEKGYETNYVKIRDLANVLNGTKAQFNVGWNGKASITSGTAYAPDGTENKTPYSGNQTYKSVSDSPVSFDGKEVKLTSFTITYQSGGYTYYKLLDLAQLLNFDAHWDSSIKSIVIETDKPHTGN